MHMIYESTCLSHLIPAYSLQVELTKWDKK
jgi:hypothetical protein